MSLKRIFTLFSFLLLTSICLQAQAVQLSGTVFGGSSPLSDVHISLYVQGEDEASAAVTTDSSGQYLLDVSAGSYDLVITPLIISGYASTGVTGIIVDASDVIQNVVLIDNASVLSGVVRDGTGTPISNIRLTVNDQASGTAIATLISGVNGGYSIGLANGNYEVDVVRSGTPNQPSPNTFYLWPIVDNLTVSGTTNYDINLPFITLSGTTTDTNGMAIAGVTLSVDDYWSDSSSGSYQFRKVITSTTSDELGNYSMVVLEGLDNITLTPPIDSGLATTVVNGLALSADSVRDFSLQQQSILSGVVRDGTGTPISNIRLTVNDQASGTAIATLISGVNGGYSIGLANGNYEVDVVRSGTPNQPSPNTFYLWPIVDNLTVSGTTNYDINLPFITLSGTTTDTNGMAIAGVTLSVDDYWSDSSSGSYQFRKVITSTTSDELSNYSMVVLEGLDNETIIPPTDSGFAQTVLNGLNLQQDTNQAIILNFVDTVASTILNGPIIRDITSSSVVIEWTTDEPTNSTVTISGQTINDSAFVTHHVVPVTGLTANNSYSVTVESTDKQGNGPASGVASVTTLETPDNQAPVIITGPLVEQVTHNSAVIKFTTDEVATGVVKLYQGETLIAELNTALTTEHEVLFAQLNANASYEVQVEVSDSLANGPTLSQRIGFVTLAIADTTAPIILSGPFISGITSSEATVTWMTNEPATSGVSYNDGTAYGVLNNDELTTDHKMRLTGLASGIEYSVTVSSQDAKANGPTLSKIETFTTLVTLDTSTPKLLGMPLVHEINNSYVGLFVHTDEAAAVQINFGLSVDNLTQKAGQTEAGTKTKINLQHLDAATQYFYQVQLTDETGNSSSLPEIYSVITAAQNKNKALSFAVPPVVEYTSESTMVVVWRTHQQTEGQLRCTAVNGNVQLVQSKVIDNDSGNRSKGLRHQATLTDLELDAAYECSAVAYTAKGDPVGMSVEQTQLTASLFDDAITGGGTVTMNAQVDATAPIFISEPAVAYISNSLAVIEWETDELANASVSYWPQGSTEIQRKSSTEFLNAPQLLLNNLISSTVYEYQVEVADPTGNRLISATKSFTSTATPDVSAPLFASQPIVSNVDDNSLVIGFTGNEYVTTQISYGSSADDLSESVFADKFQNSHSIKVSDLTSASNYYYQVSISDISGNITVSDVLQAITSGTPDFVDTDGDGVEDSFDSCPLNSGLSTNNASEGDIKIFQYCFSQNETPKIHFQIELSDNFSNAQTIQILYWLTDNEQHWITATRDPITGMFIANIELNQYSASGTYDVRSIRLVDNQGVEVNLNQDQLNVLGFNTTTTFSNPDSDNTKPSPTSVTSAGWAINESEQPEINFEVVVEDDLSGVQDTILLELNSPTGTSIQEYGTKVDGNTYSFDFIIDKYASSGVYQVNTIRLYDNAGNSNFSQNWIANNLQGYQLTNPNSDATLPSNSYINLSAKFDKESDRPIITIDGLATDDVSGIEHVYLRLTRPNGGDLDKWQDIEQSESLLSKSFSSQIALPQIYENGEYKVDFLRLNDFAGNENTLSKANIDQQNLNSVTLLNLYYPDDETSLEYTIESSIKDDFIFGANRSNDYLSGLSGNDFIFSGDGDDHVVAGAGNDLVIGGSGQGDDVYEGNDGFDTLKYTSAELPIIVDFINGTASGANIDDDIFSGFEQVIAGQGNDIIITDSNANVVFGYTGDDVIVSSSGADELSGDDGADEFVFNDLTLSISTNFTTIVDYKPEDSIVIKEHSTTSGLAWNSNLTDSIVDINTEDQLYFTTDGADGYLILVQDINSKENSFTLKLSNINSVDNLSISAKSSKDFDDDGNYDYFDTDDDNDGVLDTADAFPLDATESVDTDGDLIGNNADTDDDGDKYLDADEIAAGSDPLSNTSLPLDTDGDFISNVTDTDDDNDSVLDTADAFPLDATESVDTDGDTIGNNEDTDDDGDKYLDADEIAAGTDPLSNTSLPLDTDGDFISNVTDTDDDNDGVLDTVDAFPLDATESVDTDGDLIGNNADTDDDNDGIIDEDDSAPLDSTIGDTLAAVFSSIEDVTVEATGVTTVVELALPEVSDNNLNAPTLASNNDVALVLGSHEITWTATDFAGNISTAIQLVHIVDTTAPEFSELPVQIVDARGLLTNIANDIDIFATDLVDGDVSAVIVGDTFYDSGEHTLELTVQDKTGNTATTEVAVHINPMVELGQDNQVEAGAPYKALVALSGKAAIYPVTIGYQLSGATSGDSSGNNSGELIIESNDKSFLEFNIAETAQAGEVLTLTLTSATNAVLMADKTMTLTVVDENQAPTVTILVEQDNKPVSIIDAQGGLVTVTATVDDLNQFDTHTVTWDVGDSAFVDASIDGSTYTFELEPALLTSATYGLSVKVTENNTSASFESLVDVDLVVEAALAALSTETDADNDGVSDADEGYADSDQDGISDYLDDDSNTSRLPLGENYKPMQTVNGLHLSLGDVVSSSQSIISEYAVVSINDIAEHGGAIGSVVDNSVDTHFEVLSNIINFNVAGLSKAGDKVPVVIPLANNEFIPANAVYRKYIASSGWFTFVTNDNNAISSALKDSDGNCPSPLSDAYEEGLVIGNNCIQLVIEDGGANDADGLANGVVKDPGVLATEIPNQAPVINLVSALSVDEETIVNLDASDTSDADGDSLTYAWTQLSGTTVELTNQSTAIVNFTSLDVTADEVLSFELTVSDGVDTVTATINVTVNDVPVATPSPEEKSIDGGGSMSWLILIAGFGLVRRRCLAKLAA